MNVKILIIYILAFLCYAADGSTVEPASFQAWKERQVVGARNHVVRLSNRIHLLKNGRYKFEKSEQSNEPLLGTEGEKAYEELKNRAKVKAEEETVKEAEKRLLKQAETRMKTALENLQYAKELSIEDYFAVYLSQFQHDPKALQKVAAKLSDTEVLELLKAMLSQTSAVTTPPSQKPSAVISDLQNEGGKSSL